MTPLYHVPAARSNEQRQYMEELERQGVCVFCPEHFGQYHEAPIEILGKHWYVTENDYPYEGAAVHLLIVPVEHVTDLGELPDEAGSELLKLAREVKRRYAIASAALIGRTGDMRFNGGSVAHLHFHFISGDVADPGHVPIRFKVSSLDSPKDLDAKSPPSSS